MKNIRYIGLVLMIAALLLFMNGCKFNKAIDVEGYKLVELKEGYAIEELSNEAMSNPVFEVPSKIGDYDIIQLGYNRTVIMGNMTKINYGDIRKLVVGDHIKEIVTRDAYLPQFICLNKVPSKYGISSFDDEQKFILGPEEVFSYNTPWYITEENIYEDFIIEKNEQNEINLLYYFGGKESVVPETINDFKVVGIEDYAFRNSIIEDIELSSNLREIGKEAFYRTNLKEIFIPNSIETVGDSAFAGTYNLTKIEFEEGTKTIFKAMFSSAGTEADRPLEVTLPESLLEIKESAFKGSNLSTIDLPDSISSIERYAFSYTKLEVLKLPKMLSYLHNIVGRVDTLKELHINENLLGFNFSDEYTRLPLLDKITVNSNNKYFYIEDQMLQTKDSIVMAERTFKQEKVTISKNIRSYAFYNVKGIKELKLNYSDTLVNDYTFAEMRDLEKVTLADHIIDIRSHAFAYNHKLKVINLSNVKYIYWAAFFRAHELETVDLKSIEVIDSFSFAQTGLKSVYIPQSCIKIGQRAFGECDSLKTITFENFDKIEIEMWAFRGTPYENNQNKN